MDWVRILGAVAVALATITTFGSAGLPTPLIARICSAGASEIVRLPLEGTRRAPGHFGACHAICSASAELRKKIKPG